ncbi:MAG: SHOCT domain-containing protein [Candidatus Dormiibacterota bacterium]
MPQSDGAEGCVAGKIARLAQLRDSGALTDQEFQRLKKACLGMPRIIFPLAVFYLVVLLAVFATYILAPGFRTHIPASLGPIPSGVVWFGATGAVMASLYGIFVHNRNWNASYNYWHYCRPFFGASRLLRQPVLPQRQRSLRAVEPIQGAASLQQRPTIPL